ncbi:PLP-dependent aminotransferase family protein [Acinetobacter sp. R933-2]|uniref:MocR-like pyridoxine biosynthesis transcription factor PdxR n=1 Tax=Acinetobacter TaxID=469 RepID=UPI002574E670|nr:MULTISPECIES: PLP-dependent aminotransferase family protein [Acinetobacter]MDM1246256.1 PLP-dependent aminotransferase family protein [Acinetobacter sp. R933-2]MDQ9021073.1 PLP-dependent aminotransferase family protein [Acinetobacter sichuanensis]
MRSLLGDHLLQRLQQQTEGALYQRVFRCLRDAMIEDVLPPKTRLPASRDLAHELNVSRNTILNAYEQLQAQGYVEAFTGSGTWVSEKLPETYLNVSSNESSIKAQNSYELKNLSKRGMNFFENAAASPNQWGAFVPGVPDVTEFPHAEFSKILLRLNRQPSVNNLIYTNEGGCLELKQALAEYLRVARSVKCDTDQILITEGIHQAVDFISRVLCDVDDHVWVEDPGYWGARNILTMNGLNIHPMAVDHEGIIPDPTAPVPKLIFVTPSHQYPLGSHLSLSRRRQLLDLARVHRSWIIEDDYDSEFRFEGQPFPSLQGLEENTPVIYMGTFSKTIYPALRVGYMVVPKSLVSGLKTISAELYRGGHMLTQQALAEFIQMGHYAAHIRRMRLLYTKRRAFLIELIERYLGSNFVHEYSHEAGLHLVLKLPDHADDVAIGQIALTRGVKVRPLSQYFIQNQNATRGLLLGFACVAEKEMLMAFSVLRQCLKEHAILPEN